MESTFQADAVEDVEGFDEDWKDFGTVGAKIRNYAIMATIVALVTSILILSNFPS